MEFARHGQKKEEIINNTKKVLGHKLVQPNVKISRLLVEVVYENSDTELIEISNPICTEYGDFEKIF